MSSGCRCCPARTSSSPARCSPSCARAARRDVAGGRRRHGAGGAITRRCARLGVRRVFTPSGLQAGRHRRRARRSVRLARRLRREQLRRVALQRRCIDPAEHPEVEPDLDRGTVLRDLHSLERIDELGRIERQLELALLDPACGDRGIAGRRVVGNRRGRRSTGSGLTRAARTRSGSSSSRPRTGSRAARRPRRTTSAPPHTARSGCGASVLARRRARSAPRSPGRAGRARCTARATRRRWWRRRSP